MYKKLYVNKVIYSKLMTRQVFICPYISLFISLISTSRLYLRLISSFCLVFKKKVITVFLNSDTNRYIFVSGLIFPGKLCLVHRCVNQSSWSESVLHRLTRFIRLKKIVKRSNVSQFLDNRAISFAMNE